MDDTVYKEKFEKKTMLIKAVFNVLNNLYFNDYHWKDKKTKAIWLGMNILPREDEKDGFTILSRFKK